LKNWMRKHWRKKRGGEVRNVNLVRERSSWGREGDDRRKGEAHILHAEESTKQRRRDGGT